MSSNRALLLLILATSLARIGFGWAIGLGIDESYMVVAGRGPLLAGYFDHPPIAWWMARLAVMLTGSEAAIVVRLPFIALFALSTWLVARLSVTPRAGLWAAVAFNLAPVFGATTGGWVLPDGPLIASLLGATLCLMRALPRPGWSWWLAAGGCVGLALLSKYTSVLWVAGALLFLIWHRPYRAWLARPQPYVAGIVALAMFTPVIVWNAGNGWASLAFQGGRAAAAVFRPFGPLVTLGGEALFLLPWIWAGLMFVLSRGLFGAEIFAKDLRARLLCCLALPPILLFAVVSFWSRQVLFHWASPGYAMLFPLLGAWLAEWRYAAQAARLSVALVVTGLLVVAAVVRLDQLRIPGDPALQARDWFALRPALLATGLRVASVSWADTGKVGIGMGGDVEVFCLNADSRQFRFSTIPPLSGDLAIVAPKRTLAQMQAAYAGTFERIEPSTPVRVGPTDIPVFIGRGLKSWPR